MKAIDIYLNLHDKKISINNYKSIIWAYNELLNYENYYYTIYIELLLSNTVVLKLDHNSLTLIEYLKLINHIHRVIYNNLILDNYLNIKNKNFVSKFKRHHFISKTRNIRKNKKFRARYHFIDLRNIDYKLINILIENAINDNLFILFR